MADRGDVDNRLVDELLDLSRIQAVTLEYAQDTVDLGELLEEVVDVIQGPTLPSLSRIVHRLLTKN
ncbi:hypothetical protein [Ktedonobacter robiniae]|uniref:Uncharacterized protein n=1 Tax=Ktedonobacter robiniae TaxID=2778365 RepID=A0ABQ3UP42_9CHLR|nr:hypothetical protein [Ktedonobacter robiniae]GHO54506.1 hypothetical protein KSB_29810 [Ktedonobacter robiniae]